MPEQEVSRSAILKNASTSQVKAFVEMIVLVAYADDELSTMEERVLLQNLRRLTDGRLDDSYLQELINGLPPFSKGKDNWRAKRFSELSTTLNDKDLRTEAFAVAVDVARSESGIGVREMQVLLNMAAELKIELSLAQSLLDRPQQALKTLFGPF